MSKATHSYCLFETAFGVCGVAWSDVGLTRVQLPERDRAATEERLRRRGAQVWPGDVPEPIAPAVELLGHYFAGAATDFRGLALDFREVGDFNGRVYAALRDVAAGDTVTYGELARRVGSAGAAQAVGTAMARNPWPVVVPCHRVLAAGKGAGGFSAYGGLQTKQRLLRLEGVELGDGQMTFEGL